MSRKLIAFVIIALFATSNAFGDVLYSDPDNYNAEKAHYYRFLNDTDNNGWHFADSSVVTNATTDQVFRAFCIDHYTKTSEDFANPEVGQVYGAIDLDSPSMTLYTDAQKSALNSLFSNVYSAVFDVDGMPLNELTSYVFQLAVWEIVHETSGLFSLTDGVFGINAAATYKDPADRDQGSVYDWTVYNKTVDMSNSWFDALAGNVTWESIGYGGDYYYDYDLTVYVAEGGNDVSQTLISTVGPAAATPEPASMLIFGLGALAGAPLLRRKFRKK